MVTSRLYPDHSVLFPGSLELAVRRFVEAVPVRYREIRLRDARRAKIEHAVVVDTRSPRRLGEVWDLIAGAACPITLIDHHRSDEGDLEPSEDLSRPVGATSTIVAQLLEERGLVPSPEEASLLLMGIYEDTGGLSYRETTPEDLHAAAWLLEHGGSLEWIRRWVLKGLEPEQLDLLGRLAGASDELTINGVQVALSAVEVDRYHEEAAYVVHKWVETFDYPVGVALILNPPQINLILRSHVPGFDAGRVAARFGGGGHATAASARVVGRVTVEVREELLQALAEELPRTIVARDLAGRHLFTAASGETVAKVKERMNELRVNALPVQEPDARALAGVVTRQILDRALSLGLGDRPVDTVMQPGVPSVDAETPIEVLRDVFLERSQRFVVVEEEQHPVGVITRMQLFRHLFEEQQRAGSSLDNRMAGQRLVSQAVSRLLREVPPPWVRDIVPLIGRVGDLTGTPVYLVGGMPRDLLLGRPSEDLDLVVEGDGLEFAEALVQEVGGRTHPHPPFLTSVVTLPSGHRIDVASARTEFYRTPAALPEVETSLIRQDLYRRDFTINALAVALSGDSFGQLLDFFGGRRDLERGEIRVLHSLSFIDDPTRAIRASRYARRLGFAVAADTQHLIATAIGEGVFDRLSGQRFRHELDLLLRESHPAESMAMLAELGLLVVLDPDLEWNPEVHSRLMDVEALAAWYGLQQLGPEPEPLKLYLGGLAAWTGGDGPRRLAERLGLAGRLKADFVELGSWIDSLASAIEKQSPISALAGLLDRSGPEPALLAMARQTGERRHVLAEALQRTARLELPVTGRDLMAAGLPPGPHIGLGLRAAREALLDGSATPAEAKELAVQVARETLEQLEADETTEP